MVLLWGYPPFSFPDRPGMLCSAEFTASATAHTVEEPTGTLQIAQLHQFLGRPEYARNWYVTMFSGPQISRSCKQHQATILNSGCTCVFCLFFEGGFGHNAQVFQERNLAMWLNISAVEMCWAGTSTTILIKFEEKARESCENRGTSPIVTPLMQDRKSKTDPSCQVRQKKLPVLVVLQVMARERRSERTWGRG